MNSLVLALTMSLSSPVYSYRVSIDDLYRFPGPSACKEWIDFGKDHRSRLWSLWQILPEGPEARTIYSYYEIVNRRVIAWESLSKVWDDSYKLETRLYYLRELRSLIGEEEYFCGYVPPPLLLDYFYLVD